MSFKIFFRSLGLLAVFLLLSFIYLRHFDSIGKLPAESIEYSAPDSRMHTLEKYKAESGGCHVITPGASNAVAKGPGRVQIFGPSIPLGKVDQELLDLVDPSYVFLVQDGRLYAADEVNVDLGYGIKIQGYIQGGVLEGYISNVENARFVQVIKKDTSLISTQLLEQGYVTKSSMELLEKKSKEYYSRCPSLSKNEKLGVTEYFWAAEGRSVLHHWAHLYEGAVFGSAMKAQYGVIVPVLAQFISSMLPNDGPTQYISVVWILFYLAALLYCFLLFLIFKEYPVTVIVVLLVKIILFINLREFIIFLAPGSHWFRELNFLLIYIISSYFIFSDKKYRHFNIPLLLLFALTLLFDPMSGVFGWAAVVLSYAIYFYKNHTIKITAKKIWTAAAIFLVLIITFIAYSSNAQYFFSMMKGNIFSSELSDKAIRYLVFNGLMLFVMVMLYINNKLSYKYIYFAFLGNISIVYYLMTPDWVHYYKYLEYIVIFYMCIFIVSYNFIFFNTIQFCWFKNYVLNKFNSGSIKFLKIAILLIVFLAIFSQLSKFNKINNTSPLTKFYGSDHQVFFSADNFTINHKKISADISRELGDHLAAYPSTTNQNYIVSNFDKYILFLYNVKNNFGFVDLRSQMVDDKEMNKIISSIQKNGGGFIVDQKNFQINPGYGPKISGDPILIEGDGKYFLGPYNYIKSQLRMAKISEYIFNHCAKNDQQSNDNWSTFSCPASTGEVSK